MSVFRIIRCLTKMAAVFMFCSGPDAQSQEISAHSPRLTPLVKVIRDSESAIASLFVIVDQGQLTSGGGTIIHSSGYILTNNHVLPRNEGIALIGADLPEKQKPEQFMVVGRLPEKDLAIVKLKTAGPFPTVPLGRSHDVLNGESIVVAGNPGGRGLVFTSGIISSRKVLSGAPNALVMTNYRNSRRDTYLQFDAASNGGNSGGGLINLEGRLIGVVWGGIRQEQNIGFAIPVDVLHQLIEEIVEPELRNRRTTGMLLKADGIAPVVAEVRENSAATEAGLLPGDELLAVNGETLRHRVDWFLTLHQLLPSGRKFTVTVRRNNQSLDLSLSPRELQPMAAAVVEDTQTEQGLRYGLYHGSFSLVPDFTKLTPEREGIIPVVNLPEMIKDRKDQVAVRLQGLLKILKAGLYRLVISSDDGSRLLVNGRMVIDNDGNHAAQPRGRLLYLSEGFHEVQLEYFEGNGAEELTFQYESEMKPGLVPVPAEMLWHRK